MEQMAALALLGIAGELPPTRREVAGPGPFDARHQVVNSVVDTIEDVAVGERNLAERWRPIIVQNQRVIETARAQQHCSAATGPASDWHRIGGAGHFTHVLHEPAAGA